MLTKNTYIKRDVMGMLLVLAFLSSLLGLVLPFSLLIIFDRVIPNQTTATLWCLYLIILAAILLDSQVKKCEEKLTKSIADNVEQNLSNSIFKSLCHANLTRFKELGMGDYLERIRTVSTLKNYLAQDTVKALVNSVTCLVIFIIIGIISWRAGLVLLIASLLLLALSAILSAQKIQKLKQKSNDEGQTYSKILEIIARPLDIKAAAMEYRMENVSHRLIKQREQAVIALQQLEIRLPLILGFAQQMVLIGVVIICTLSVIEREMGQGGMIAIILLTNRYFAPYRQIMHTRIQWKINVVQFNRLQEILLLEERNASENMVIVQKIIVRAAKTYHFKRGQMYIIRGASCSGKSQLMAIIAREQESDQINISVNQKPLQQYDYSEWKNATITVNADSNFIAGSIIDNITCFRPNLHKAAYALCQAMEIKEIIAKLPQGFYTNLNIGETPPFSRQVHFSLLIIRALLCEKSVLIIDDVDRVHDVAFERNLLRCIEYRADRMLCLIISNKIETKNRMLTSVPISRIIMPETLSVPA